jgi:Holliday junction resolvase
MAFLIGLALIIGVYALSQYWKQIAVIVLVSSIFVILFFTFLSPKENEEAGDTNNYAPKKKHPYRINEVNNYSSTKTTKKNFLPKEEWKAQQKINAEKGQRYELHVANHFRNNGYEVIENGKIQGRRDGGIDILAKKDNLVLLIQCKHWSASTKFKITHAILKEFIGNATMYIQKNPVFKELEIKNIFITSENILDDSAKVFLKHNSNFVEHQIVQFNG